MINITVGRDPHQQNSERQDPGLDSDQGCQRGPLRTLCMAVTPRTTNPTAVINTPAHCRRPRSKPKNRSASTARNTRPPDRMACTLESGASASASTWRPTRQAMIQPIANHRERNRSATLRAGWRISTARASPAPRALNSAPRWCPAPRPGRYTARGSSSIVAPGRSNVRPTACARHVNLRVPTGSEVRARCSSAKANVALVPSAHDDTLDVR